MSEVRSFRTRANLAAFSKNKWARTESAIVIVNPFSIRGVHNLARFGSSYTVKNLPHPHSSFSNFGHSTPDSRSILRHLHFFLGSQECELPFASAIIFLSCSTDKVDVLFRWIMLWQFAQRTV